VRRKMEEPKRQGRVLKTLRGKARRNSSTGFPLELRGAYVQNQMWLLRKWVREEKLSEAGSNEL
jgi:hypothetical protein